MGYAASDDDDPSRGLNEPDIIRGEHDTIIVVHGFKTLLNLCWGELRRLFHNKRGYLNETKLSNDLIKPGYLGTSYILNFNSK